MSGQAGLHSTAVGELERARSAFERLGDIRSEARVLLQLGAEARKRDDFDLLTRLVGRATQLTTDAGADLVGLRAIASAVTAQMGGDPDGAIASLEAVPERALTGDWGAQLHMILATNLALAGRDQDALASFERATGLGSTASQAVANDLFASTLWIAGRFDAALEAAGEAEALARRAEVPVTIDLTIAARACLLALAGDDDARSLLDGFDRRRATDGEALALAGVAHAVLAIHEGDLDGAAEVLAELPPPARRPTRSKLWRAALESSLGSEGEDRWRTAAAEDRSLRRAVEAASFARARLRDGTAVPARARPFLPACWWSPSHPRVHLRFLGGATVHRDRRATDVPAWQRGRVRELALHLATRRGVDRAAVAAALWPDLNAPSASRNLRVTLSHLLDVLDPERTRGQSSTAVVDAAGSLHLAEVDWLRVDVVELEGAAQDVLASAGIDDLSGALAACRRLLRFDEGPLLGGASAGEWLEPVRRRLDDLVLRAAEVGAQLALDIGENALAGELGRRMVVLDPWAERGHRLIIAAHLADGDFDAARRAVTETLRVLSALDVAPLPETLELAHRSGWQTVRRPHDLVAGQPPA